MKQMTVVIDYKTKDVTEKKCPICSTLMIFYPGCCGNLPVWRCTNCGIILKWQEPKILESDRYLILK